MDQWKSYRNEMNYWQASPALFERYLIFSPQTTPGDVFEFLDTFDCRGNPTSSILGMILSLRMERRKSMWWCDSMRPSSPSSHLENKTEWLWSPVVTRLAATTLWSSSAGLECILAVYVEMGEGLSSFQYQWGLRRLWYSILRVIQIWNDPWAEIQKNIKTLLRSILF